MPELPTFAITSRMFTEPAQVEALAGEFLDSGFQQLSLDPNLRQPVWEELLKYYPPRSFCAASLMAPLPPLTRAGPNKPPRLGSLDRSEQKECIQKGNQTIEFSNKYEIPFVYLPIAKAEEPTKTDISNELERKRVREEVWERFWLTRNASEIIQAQVDGYLRVLSELLAHADRYSVKISLVPGGMPFDIPLPLECELIRNEFEGAPLVTFLDLPSYEKACRQSTPGFENLLNVEANRLAGVLVHDGRVFQNQLPLGQGDVDLNRIQDFAQSDSAQDLKWIIDLAPPVNVSDYLNTREALEPIFNPPSNEPTDSIFPF